MPEGAAVNRDIDAGDPGRGVGHQEGDNRSHICRRPDPPQRNQTQVGINEVLWGLVLHRGVDIAREDAVHPDAAGPKLHAGDAREPP